MRRFAAAWRFLTAFPFLLPPGEDEGEMLGRSAVMFPFVGLALGVLAASGAVVANRVLPPIVVSALGVAALAFFSLGLHLDGLADCADALLSPGRDRDTALAIMKDSRIGAHGAMGLVALLLIKFACLASLPGEDVPLALFLAPLGGRVAMLFPMFCLPYAREKGLGGIFIAEKPAVTLGWASFLLAVVACIGLGYVGGLALISVTIGVACAWTAYLRRRLGGGTGDTYGAACEFGETAALLAVAATLAQ